MEGVTSINHPLAYSGNMCKEKGVALACLSLIRSNWKSHGLYLQGPGFLQKQMSSTDLDSIKIIVGFLNAGVQK